MSHPVPGHDYSEDTYESHSPHKEHQGQPKRKGRKAKAKALRKMGKTIGNPTKEDKYKITRYPGYRYKLEENK